MHWHQKFLRVSISKSSRSQTHDAKQIGHHIAKSLSPESRSDPGCSHPFFHFSSCTGQRLQSLSLIVGDCLLVNIQLLKKRSILGQRDRITWQYPLSEFRSNKQGEILSPYIHVVNYLVSWLFFLFWAQCAHAQLIPFYHPFYPDVTHVRRDTGPSPAFPYCKLTQTWIRPFLLHESVQRTFISCDST